MVNEVVIVDNLTKTFKMRGKHNSSSSKTSRFTNGRLVALNNISFRVFEGEVFGIIGFNGGGKTTLLRTIAGLYQPDSGKITVKGHLAPLLQLGIGFQNELTAPENIIMSGMLHGISKSEMKNRVEKIIEFAELEEFADMQIKNYSNGMRARLSFSTALQIDPDILLVDEILAVGDIGFREKSQKAFLSFKEKGKTILYATHSLGMLPKLCDRVLLIHHGKIVMIGSPEEVVKRYKELALTEK